MNELLEKYTVWENEASCVKLTFKHKTALFDGPVVLLMSGRKVQFEKRYESPKAAKKAFIKKTTEFFNE